MASHINVTAIFLDPSNEKAGSQPHNRNKNIKPYNSAICAITGMRIHTFTKL